METPNPYHYEIGYVQGAQAAIEVIFKAMKLDEDLMKVAEENVLSILENKRPNVFKNYKKGIVWP